MEGRGRKSAASLRIVQTNQSVAISPPSPPNELSKEQKLEWERIVQRLPHDWFPEESWPLLMAYCRHITNMRHIAKMIQVIQSGDEDDAEDIGVDLTFANYDKLLKMHQRETSAMASLATRMRLSQQSSYDFKKMKGNKKTGKTLWQE